MLDDHAPWAVEVAADDPRRVEVEHVVERQRLSVQLRHPREHVRARAGLHIERGALVWVLAVGEVELLLPRRDPVLRHLLVAPAEPAADRRVVSRRGGKRLVGEPVPRRGRQLAGLLELGQDGVVAGRLHHDGHEPVVLRRRADHRRPADVDVLDRLVLGHVAARDRALERIEVHADEVDRLDRALAQRLGVVGVVAHCEQRRVQVGMKRLDPPIQDLREPGQVLDRPHLDASLLDRGEGAAGRDDLDALLGQALGEVGHPGLVGDRDQRPADGQRLAGGLGNALGGG